MNKVADQTSKVSYISLDWYRAQPSVQENVRRQDPFVDNHGAILQMQDLHSLIRLEAPFAFGANRHFITAQEIHRRSAAAIAR